MWATDPFEGQRKLRLSEKPVFNFCIHHFFKTFYSLLPYPLDIFNTLVHQAQEPGRRLDIVRLISSDLLYQ